MCDVVLFDGKTKREYKLIDSILVGNDKDLIWSNDYFRDVLIRDAFKTKARIATQQNNLNLTCKHIEFKKLIGHSNVQWGCVK
jgi:hypothetical protein